MLGPCPLPLPIAVSAMSNFSQMPVAKLVQKSENTIGVAMA